MTLRVVLAEDQSMVLGAFASLLDLEPDIETPGMTGLDVAAERQRAGDPTPVLIVTTFARSGYLHRALDAGVSGCVLKDVPVADLVTALRTVAGGGRVIAPELAVAAGDRGSADAPGT